jgi:hypothetical protein
MEDVLTYPQPVPDLATGYLIKLSHARLVIGADFELTQEVRLDYYTDDAGTFGLPVADAINLNPNLTEDQKRRLVQMFKPSTRTSTTAGVMLDPVSLEPVAPDESGSYPAGAFPEKLIWLNALASQVPGEKLSDKVKALLLESMRKMVSRGRI